MPPRRPLDRLLRLRLTLGLAMVMLAAALAPTVSRALVAAQALPAWALSEICRSPSRPAEPASPGQAPSLHGSDCALCQLARDLPPLPTAEPCPGRLAPAPDLRVGGLAIPAVPRAPPAWQRPPLHAPPFLVA